MTEAPPITCSLSTEELPKRVANGAALGAAGLFDLETQGPRARLRFRRGTDVRAGIDAFVAAESKCCAFFEFDLAEGGEELVLSIAAPAEATSALRRLVAVFVSGWAVPA